MAGRFKAVSLCRSCEKRGCRQTRRRAVRKSGCACWARRSKGVPAAVSASRVCSQCVPVAQGCWQKWKWKRSYYSTDEVPREKKETAPCWTCPLLRPLLPSGWHRPRGRLHLLIVSQEDTQTPSHETVRAGARSPSVLWTLVSKFRRVSRSAGARVKTLPPLLWKV